MSGTDNGPAPVQVDESAAFESDLALLATLPTLEYERRRQGKAKCYGISAVRLDRLVKERREGGKAGEETPPPAEALPFEETEPWPEPVDAAALLDEIETIIARFIVCDPPVRVAATLWPAFTWFIDVVQVAPIALITAPEKACGKTQLLAIFTRLCARAMPSSGITAPAFFRAIERLRPSLMIDEGDSFLPNNEELRGVINSGHTRETAYIIRTVGEEHIPATFSTWGAKAIAGIRVEKIAPTITDRSIKLPMRKKLKTEKVERLRRADPDLFPVLRRKLARFAEDAADAVKQAQAEVPDLEALTDRQMDNWEPLLAIAQAAGGAWPAKAREAALALSRVGEESAGTGPELLANIYAVFQEQKQDPFASAEKIATADLLKALCENEEWRWATYNKGRPIAARQVAAILKGYGINSTNVNLGGDKRPKGYIKADFEDAFARYISVSGPSSPVLSATPLHHNDFNKLRGKFPATPAEEVAGEKPCNPLKSQESSGVADKTPPTGAESEKEVKSWQI